MTDDTVNATLVPIAAELIGVVRDFGPDDVAAVLARVPDGRHDALAVVLAAMVDPDARPSELLAWTRQGPVQTRDREPRVEKKPGKVRKSRSYPREHGTDRGYRQHANRGDMPPCAKCLAAHSAKKAAQRARYRVKQKATEAAQRKAS